MHLQLHLNVEGDFGICHYGTKGIHGSPAETRQRTANFWRTSGSLRTNSNVSAASFAARSRKKGLGRAQLRGGPDASVAVTRWSSEYADSFLLRRVHRDPALQLDTAAA